MRGVGRATGAMTFLNALFTGIGAAAALPIGVEVRAGFGAGAAPDAPPGPLVARAVESALAEWGSPGTDPIRVEVRSDIPPGQGLKSSSAVASATIAAVADLLDVHPAPLEIARRSARVGRAAGVSATGALDDALAGLVDGVVVTDNRQDRWIGTHPVPEEWGAVVYAPDRPHPPSPALVDRFARYRPKAEPIERMVRHGDLIAALNANGELVESAMGYDYAPIRAALRDAGAVAAGVSGMGPALVALGPADRLASIGAGLPAAGRRYTFPTLGRGPAGGGRP
ncbi:MAG: shikimate kinase [Thermoplasmata archaeon]